MLKVLTKELMHSLAPSVMMVWGIIYIGKPLVNEQNISY